MPTSKQPLRLRRRHAPTDAAQVSAEDGVRLVNAQSMRNALVAGLISVVVFSILWVMLTRLTDRVFPWMTVLLGFMTGYAIRRAGRGVDARFPILAGSLALLGSLVANIVVAASNKAETLGVGTLEVLRSVTLMTWPVYFDEVITAADYIFAVIAAVVAAFYANRRLTRKQYRALRLYEEQL
jgi:hypothetical protein